MNNNWISTKISTPTDQKRYLVIHKHRYITIATYSNKIGMWGTPNAWLTNVTHWQALPTPPSKLEKNEFGWTSVKDSLPEDFESVLVNVQLEHYGECYLEAYLDNGIWFPSATYIGLGLMKKPLAIVTHWLSLLHPSEEKLERVLSE